MCVYECVVVCVCVCVLVRFLPRAADIRSFRAHPGCVCDFCVTCCLPVCHGCMPREVEVFPPLCPSCVCVQESTVSVKSKKAVLEWIRTEERAAVGAIEE